MPLTVLICAGVLIGTSGPATAATTDPARAATTGPGVADTAAGSTPLTVRLATTEHIRAMAASGNGQLMTVGGPAAKGQNAGDGVVMNPMVTCWLSVGTPYGGGAYNRPVYVTAYTYCNDYVDWAVITVELYHSNDRVGSYYSAFFYVTNFTATAASSGCQDGFYYGSATGTIYRGNSSTAFAVGQPLNMGCAPPPPPPVVANPGNQTTWQYASGQVQMSATGGTAPYTWSATGLPFGFTINSSTGLISGSSSQMGQHAVTVRAVDAAGASASTQFTWVIRPRAVG